MKLPARMPSRNSQILATTSIADLLPVFIRENRILRAQSQVIQLARAIETFVAPVLRAANHVVAAAGDRLVGQDQFFERFEIDRKLQTSAGIDVAAAGAG